MSLSCGSCGAEHNLDEAPDTGVCLRCGGDLMEPDDRQRDGGLTPRVLMGMILGKVARVFSRDQRIRRDDAVTQMLTGDTDSTFRGLTRGRD